MIELWQIENKNIETAIKLLEWIPLSVCSTLTCTFGDFSPVWLSWSVMIRNNQERYSGSTVRQTIQNDRIGQPLYSYDLYPKYISESKNRNIWVADNKARAEVVINEAGKLQCTYTGVSFFIRQPFIPVGVTKTARVWSSQT